MNPLDDQESKVSLISMPWPHMMIRLIKAKNVYFMASRGGFKTSLALAPYTEECAYEFPRGTGVIVGPSFEHLYDNTVNALMKSLKDLGLVEGVHFVVRTPPPKSWPKPIIEISSKKYDNIITWHTGYTDQFISLERIGASNALSVVSGKFDESKLLDQAKLIDQVFPIFRPFKGMPEHWKNSPLYMSKVFCSDKLEGPGKMKWLLDKQKLNDPVRNDLIITLQLAVNTLKFHYNKSGINRRAELKPQIHALEVRLINLRKGPTDAKGRHMGVTLYMEANHVDVQKIQGAEWYDDKVLNMGAYELKVAIHNENPTRPENGYYPDFDEKIHCYDNDVKDYDHSKGLVIASDYQHSVSPICIVQPGKLPGRDTVSLNYIDEVYTLAPEGLEMAVQKFCDKYAHHTRKFVWYVYDQTAIGKRNDAVEYNKTVIGTLRKNHWIVKTVYTGSAPEHGTKYQDVKAWLRNDKKETMDIRINRDKCPKTIISITGAEAIVVSGKTKKEKKYENTTRYPKLDQSETTHFSDVFDMINHAAIKLKKISRSSGGGSMGFR